jgi:hypothetical protein
VTLLHWLIVIILAIIVIGAIMFAIVEAAVRWAQVPGPVREHPAPRDAGTGPVAHNDLVISPEAEELIRQRVRDAIRHPVARPGLRVVPDCERCRTGCASLPCGCDHDCGDSACLGGAA